MKGISIRLTPDAGLNLATANTTTTYSIKSAIENLQINNANNIKDVQSFMVQIQSSGCSATDGYVDVAGNASDGFDKKSWNTDTTTDNPTRAAISSTSAMNQALFFAPNLYNDVDIIVTKGSNTTGTIHISVKLNF